jgi:head-tail adaptor
MRAGKLRHEVQIIDRATKALVCTWWCDIRTPSGRESFSQMQLQNTLTHVLEGRWEPRIRGQMDVVFRDPDLGERKFEILSARDPNLRRRQMVLDCQELRAGAA